ncbi:hypothetical protein GUITHDRAFT_66405, partial [Guillardia theta CCMP2712]
TARKISIIFVSSDFSEEDATTFFKNAHGDWLMLDYKSALRSELKRKFGVWAGKEASQFGTSIASFKSRRSGIPALAIVGLDGELVNFLNAELEGFEALM